MTTPYNKDYITVTTCDTTDPYGNPGTIFYDNAINTITISDGNGYYGVQDNFSKTDSGINIEEGDLVVKGRNVLEELDIIKDLLEGAVIERNPAMEDEFSKLKELASEYKKHLEKYKTFKKLKD